MRQSDEIALLLPKADAVKAQTYFECAPSVARGQQQSPGNSAPW